MPLDDIAGYFYLQPDELKEFGDESLRGLLPFWYLAGVKPVNRIVAWMQEVPDYRHETGHAPLGIGALDKYHKRMEPFSDAIVIFNIPLPIKRLSKDWMVDKRKEDQGLMPEFPSFPSRKAYEQALEETLPDGRLIYHVKHDQPWAKLFIIGSKDATGTIMHRIKYDGSRFPDIIREYAGVDALDMYRGKKSVITYDVDRDPVRNEHLIFWRQ